MARGGHRKGCDYCPTKKQLGLLRRLSRSATSRAGSGSSGSSRFDRPCENIHIDAPVLLPSFTRAIVGVRSHANSKYMDAPQR